MAALAETRWRPPPTMDPIPRLNVALGLPEPVAPAYDIPDATEAAGYGPEYVPPPHVPAARAEVGEPMVGDADGDEPLVGGAISPEDQLIEDAAVPTKDDWSEIEAAMPSLPPDRVKYVLSGVLRKMATWGLPNLKDFLEYRFKPEGGVLTMADIAINVPGPFGETALMQAAVNGRVDAAKLLIKEGAKVNAQNKDGETALMWAAAYDESEIIELLLAEGAKPNLTDNRGFNALMVAVWTGSEKAVRLLKPKSNKTAKDKNGFTVSELPTIDVSPAKVRGAQKTVLAILAEEEPKTGFRSWFTRSNKTKGGKKTQRRQKTKQKKRSTR